MLNIEKFKEWVSMIDTCEDFLDSTAVDLADVIAGKKSCRYCAYNDSQECLSADCSEGILKYLKSEVQSNG